MPRRHHPPESVHAQRWIVSYADFMTLMFAFFVVLYAASSLNDEKFKQMSQVFVGVFDQPVAVNLPSDIQSMVSDITDRLQIHVEDKDKALTSFKSEQSYQQLSELVSGWVDKSRVNILRSGDYFQLEVPADYLFEENTANISVEGDGMLSQLAKVFKTIPNFIHIEVFSDNQVEDDRPWQLAASQGIAIMDLLILDDVSPLRLAAVNYGPFQPVATNDDDEGRSINRRVLFLINDNKDHMNRIKTVTDQHLSANPIE